MSFHYREVKKLPSKEEILDCVTDVEIFEYYLGKIPRRKICSPMRDDKIPSFGVFYSDRYGMLFYKDHATGETGNVFVFVKRLFGYTSFMDALIRVCTDMGLTQFSTNGEPSKTFVRKKNTRSAKSFQNNIKISVTTRKWNLDDKEFWYNKYGITCKMLKRCRVYPIEYYFLNDYCVKAAKLAYAFVEEKDGKITVKLYQPESEHKWISNNDASVWELWTQLPKKGKKLVIASSRKDAMVIKSLFDESEVTACALQGEKFLPKEQVIEELLNRFDEVYVLYDNDYTKSTNWGRVAGERLCERHPELKQIEINESYLKKDPSDFREEYGEEETLKLLKKLLCLK